MNDGIIAAIIVISIFGGFIGIIKAFTDYKLKRKLIESGAIDPQSIKLLEGQDTVAKNSTLKWGLVILLAGLGLIVIEILDGINLVGYDSVLPFGIEMVFISAGFLIYVQMMKKQHTA